MTPAALFLALSLAACNVSGADVAGPPGAAPAVPGDDAGDQAVELGRVRWRSDHDEAFREAKATGRPVLLLFQEIPG